MRLTFDLQDAAMLAAIDESIDQLAHPRDLFDEIGAVLEANINQRANNKVDPNGMPWAPLSPATIEIYESDWFIKRNSEFKGGIPGSLLNRTNAMMRTLNHNAGDDFAEVGFSRATPGGKWQVSMLHEFGTKKMPRRGLLTADPEAGTLGEQDQADVMDTISRMLGGLFAS